MRAAFIIAAKDIRQRVRDRSAILVSVVAPLALAAVFSLVLPRSTTSLDWTFGIVDLDGGALASPIRDRVLQGLVDAGVAKVSTFATEADGVAAVAAGDVAAVVVVPEDFSATVQRGEGAELRIVGSASANLGTGVLASVAQGYANRLTAVGLGVASVVIRRSAPPTQAELGALAVRAAGQESPIATVGDPRPARQLDFATYFPAAMAILFIFFGTQLGALSLLAERRGGTLPRLLAAPIPPWTILLGKSLATFVTSVAALILIVAASSFALGARWGDPAGVALIVVAGVVAAMGITTLIAAFARTEEQAAGLSSIVAFTLGILGGSFFPISQGPEILAQLSLISPHGWFLRGLGELGGGAPASAALPAVTVLVVIGLVTGVIGLARARTALVA